jgi:predicted negative regulator of RcsB-dependent stress response
LGSCYLAKKDSAAAAGQFALAASSAQPAVAADARYRLAEALLLKPDFSAAIEQLKPFSDQQTLRNIPDVSDRALLRLGHAYAHAGQWDASRQTMETLLARYAQSTWREDARYGIGWAWQNQSQWDNAVNAYTQVTKSTAAEVGARAQLQIGVCRLAQKRPSEAANALLVVPFTYDYPELSALALCEAARAFVELKQPEQAAHLLRKVIMEHEQGQWGEVARQRLAEIK